MASVLGHLFGPVENTLTSAATLGPSLVGRVFNNPLNTFTKPGDNVFSGRDWLSALMHPQRSFQMAAANPAAAALIAHQAPLPATSMSEVGLSGLSGRFGTPVVPQHQQRTLQALQKAFTRAG